MGAIWFEHGSFADHLHELVGYKAGVAASIEHMCDLLSGTAYPDDIRRSETHGIRIRSEDYDDLYYKLIHKVGLVDEPYDGIRELFKITRRAREQYGDEFASEVMSLYTAESEKEMARAAQEGRRSLDPEPILRAAANKFGRPGLQVVGDMVMAQATLSKLSPHTAGRWQQWSDVADLSDLFERGRNSERPEDSFFDQRFMDFLSNNLDKLGQIHWRKFEELTAECFSRFGYRIELGPGSHDDGVDVRLWLPEKEGAPQFLVQCKRQKEKIDKVTVKGLYADVVHEGAEQGLLVTSSEFSPGARTTVSARGYPISEVNGDMLKAWIKELRTPGTGIVRL